MLVRHVDGKSASGALVRAVINRFCCFVFYTYKAGKFIPLFTPWRHIGGTEL